MTITKKLISIFLFLFIILSAGLLLYFRLESASLRKIQYREIQFKKESFQRIKDLSARSIFVLANDYSYWDELVEAIEKEDADWARINIDSGIKTYGADAVWIYNTDGKMVYSVNRFSDDRLNSLPLDLTQIEAIFAKGPIEHFFIKTPAGYLELQGATVHASDDNEHATPAQGYFFVGKMWNNAYLYDLSVLSQAKVMIGSEQTKRPRFYTDDGFILAVADWQNQPLFNIRVKVDPFAIDNFHSQSRVYLKMFLLYTVLQMLVLLYFLRRFLRRI